MITCSAIVTPLTGLWRWVFDQASRHMSPLPASRAPTHSQPDERIAQWAQY